jgi:hypothetical protein
MVALLFLSTGNKRDLYCGLLLLARQIVNRITRKWESIKRYSSVDVRMYI